MAIGNLYWAIIFLLSPGFFQPGLFHYVPGSGEGQEIYFDINPETIIVANLIIEKSSLEEIIFGTRDKKLAVLDLASQKVCFLLTTEGTVNHIGVADINNDGQNELVFSTGDNILCMYDSNGCMISKIKYSTNIHSFVFCDVNRDKAADIILGTSTGIEAINASILRGTYNSEDMDIFEERIWLQCDLEIQSNMCLFMNTADIDNFGEEEIVGYTENTVFVLSYSGGILWKKGFEESEIAALSLYTDPTCILHKCIIIALTDGTLLKRDYKGNTLEWDGNHDSKWVDMAVSKIIPSKCDATSNRHDLFFLISSETKVRAITLSGSEIDFKPDFEVLNIECANIDKREVPEFSKEEYEEFMLSGKKPCEDVLSYQEQLKECQKKDHQEAVVSGKEGDVRVFIYCKSKSDLRESPLKSENQMHPEEVVFSKLIERSEDYFVLFQISREVKEEMGEEKEIWRVQIDEFFEDVKNVFLYCESAEGFYAQGDYGTSSIYYDMILCNEYNRNVAKYYGFYHTICQRKNREAGMEAAREELDEEIESRWEEGQRNFYKGDFLEALIDFYYAYSKSFDLMRYDDLMESHTHEIETNKRFRNIEEKIIESMLHLLHEANQNYEKGNYEEALKSFRGFCLIYEEFYLRMKTYSEENESYRQYDYILELYPDQAALVERIDSCIEHIKEDADKFFEEKKFREARHKYEIIIDILYESEIKTEEAPYTIEKSEIIKVLPYESGIETEEAPYTIEYSMEEIEEKIDECNEEIRKKNLIYLCIGGFIGFLCILLFKYRKEIDKRLFQKERWTVEELYNRLDESEKLLSTGYAEPAANLAGKVLEKALKMRIRSDTSLYQKWNPDGDPRKDERAFLGKMIPWLSEHDSKIDEIQTSKLDTWRRIRNRSSHDAEEGIHETDVNDMIDGIRDFVARFLAPKYQKS